MEQWRSKNEEILWIPARQFTKQVDSGGHDGCIGILQFLLEARKAIGQSLRMLLYNLEESKNDTLSNASSRMVQHRVEFLRQVAREVRGNEMGETVQCKCNFSRCRCEILRVFMSVACAE